jgi:membrane associated rhomboid family serine protease
MDTDRKVQALNPVPWIVWVVVLPIAGAELAFQLQALGLINTGPAVMAWRQQLYQLVVLLPDLARLQWETGGHPANELYRLVAYPLVHASFSDALFPSVLLLALGKKVGEEFSPLGFAVIVLASTLCGGLAYSFLVPGLTAPLFGAYPVVYGLIGALTYLLFTELDQSGGNRLWAFRLISFLLVAQLIFAVVIGTSWTWVAELGGFVAGFALSFAVGPGGFRRLRARMRQR